MHGVCQYISLLPLALGFVSVSVSVSVTVSVSVSVSVCVFLCRYTLHFITHRERGRDIHRHTNTPVQDV